MRELLRAGPPCVFVNRRSGEPAHDYVGPDNAQAVDLLVRHLAELGHRRIGYISGPANSSSALERLAQFSRSMGEFGLEAGDDFVFGGDYTAEAGRRGARHFLSMEPRPTAIIASNDICALGVIEHAQGLGVVIPRDLSVTGFDDVMGFDEFTENPVSFLSLTTISQPKRDLGAWAARMLLDRLSGRETGPGQTAVLGVELRRRGTTAAPSPELSPDVAAIARDGTPPARAGDMRRAHARSSAAGAPSPSGDDEAD
jgi:LacI family transcriptional regulator